MKPPIPDPHRARTSRLLSWILLPALLLLSSWQEIQADIVWCLGMDGHRRVEGGRRGHCADKGSAPADLAFPPAGSTEGGNTVDPRPALKDRNHAASCSTGCTDIPFPDDNTVFLPSFRRSLGTHGGGMPAPPEDPGFGRIPCTFPATSPPPRSRARPYPVPPGLLSGAPDLFLAVRLLI